MIAATEFAAFGLTGDRNILDLEAGVRLLACTTADEALAFIAELQAGSTSGPPG